MVTKPLFRLKSRKHKRLQQNQKKRPPRKVARLQNKEPKREQIRLNNNKESQTSALNIPETNTSLLFAIF